MYVRVCMCVCVCVYMYMCVCVCVCENVHMYTHRHTYIHTYIIGPQAADFEPETPDDTNTYIHIRTYIHTYIILPQAADFERETLDDTTWRFAAERDQQLNRELSLHRATPVDPIMFASNEIVQPGFSRQVHLRKDALRTTTPDFFRNTKS
jgi:hypothetical protein